MTPYQKRLSDALDRTTVKDEPSEEVTDIIEDLEGRIEYENGSDLEDEE